MFLPYRPSDWRGLILEFLEAERKRQASRGELKGKGLNGYLSNMNKPTLAEFAGVICRDFRACT